MLLISKEQVSHLERPLRRRLGQEVVDLLWRGSPHSVLGLEASEISERLDLALAGADLYELDDVRDLQAYVRLCFTIGPRFDEYSAFKTIWADRNLPPKRRMKTLFATATASDWVLAAVSDIVSRFQVPSESTSAMKVPVDARGIMVVPISAQHAEQYFRLTLHPDVWRLAGLQPFQTLDACEQYLQGLGTEAGKHGFAIVDPRAGLVGALSLFQREREARLSYWLGRPFWGQGIGTAALGQLTGRLKAQSGQFRIVAPVCRGNALSVRVLEKCGFGASADVEYASGRSDIMNYSRAF